MRWLYCRSRMSKSTDRVALAGVGGRLSSALRKKVRGLGGGGMTHIYGGIGPSVASSRLLHLNGCYTITYITTQIAKN